MSILSLVTKASFLVQMVMLGLMVVSIIAWTMIIQKWLVLRKSKQEANLFERRFWSGADLVDLYKALSHRKNSQGMASIFEAGFREYAKLHKQPGIVSDAVLEGAQRAIPWYALRPDKSDDH